MDELGAVWKRRGERGVSRGPSRGTRSDIWRAHASMNSLFMPSGAQRRAEVEGKRWEGPCREKQTSPKQQSGHKSQVVDSGNPGLPLQAGQPAPRTGKLRLGEFKGYSRGHAAHQWWSWD